MNAPVLIVDDSLTVRMDLSEALESAGIRTVPCSTAAEARAALQREPMALAILDVVLPDGDGVDLLEEIRAAHPETAVLMLSTEAEVKDRVRALKRGADDYVGKPYDTGYVVARAREHLRARHAPVTPGRPTVLVIDDSATFRAEVEEALEHAGYAVLLAESGEEGLRIAASRRPTAILVDSVLPGIDGATVVRRLRLDAALRGIPCVILTASDDRGAELLALDAGADAFARKESDLGVVLARLAAVLRHAAAEGKDTASLLGPTSILAVDDSPTYLAELAGMLRGEGYDVVLARSGEEALEVLAAQPIDCILLDLLMPGMGGKECCRRIKSTPGLRDVPLILLTALDERDALIAGLGLGADDYIGKSTELEVLNARVRAQLRRKQLEDEHRRIRVELHLGELAATEEHAARQIAENRAAMVDELERKNHELEAFSYSVSHDLRAPLRSIDGFSRALAEDYGAALDDRGRDYLGRVRAAAGRMGELIDDLLQLSRVSRAPLTRDRVDMSSLAQEIGRDLLLAAPQREVELVIPAELTIEADGRLMRVVLENLLGNAWKFTGAAALPRVELGSERRTTEIAYFVRDNGAGFDMAYAGRLFAPFQRLHSEAEFPGTGIGLATVARIIDRHGGRVWAEGAIGVGAAVFFTVPPVRGGGLQ